VSNESASNGHWPPVRAEQWATIALLIAVSEVVSWAGHTSASYGVDAVALLAFLGFRQLRRSRPGEAERNAATPG
jgi:hypothetical protein